MNGHDMITIAVRTITRAGKRTDRSIKLNIPVDLTALLDIAPGDKFHFQRCAAHADDEFNIKVERCGEREGI